MRIQIGLIIIGFLTAGRAHAVRAQVPPPACECQGHSPYTGSVTDPGSCNCPVQTEEPPYHHHWHHQGGYAITVGVQLRNFGDCETKVKKLQEADALGPWHSGGNQPSLTAAQYCGRLFPQSHPICDPSGPANLTCINGNQAHWDGNACRYTCAFENGTCSRNNGGPEMRLSVDCIPGYQPVEDRETCSVRCEPLQTGCAQGGAAPACPAGQHSVWSDVTCHFACQWGAD
jgi:hypothetical protein